MIRSICTAPSSKNLAFTCSGQYGDLCFFCSVLFPFVIWLSSLFAGSLLLLTCLFSRFVVRFFLFHSLIGTKFRRRVRVTATKTASESTFCVCLYLALYVCAYLWLWLLLSVFCCVYALSSVVLHTHAHTQYTHTLTQRHAHTHAHTQRIKILPRQRSLARLARLCT